ncbi:MAG: cystathionine gamma-synthase, partial [Wenzhouxiangella sp.]|nr:cystathionine gamma-synthase [Wenzhouxiangella sp.]
MPKQEPRYRAATVAARTGVDCDSQYGAVIPPLHLSSTYAFEDFARPRRHDYSRSGNPTRDHLARALADLEEGHDAVITASGMGAIHTVLHLIRPGQRLVMPADCYGGSFRLVDALARRGLFDLVWTHYQKPEQWPSDLARADWVWIETPSNPLLQISDIQAICQQARRCGARVIVDNTFLSPVLQQPLTLGADLVVHSTTKYINGHSDVVGGAVIARDPSLSEEIAWWANCIGVTGSPFDAWLTLRGLRTLEARLRVQQQTAHSVAEHLAEHPAVRRVHYPGLPTDPGHAIARRQQKGFGAMVSFELHGGEVAVRAFLEGLRLFTLAESLGGVESLVAHPSTMTHAAMPKEDQ